MRRSACRDAAIRHGAAAVRADRRDARLALGTAQEPSHETARSRARSRPPYYKFSSVMCATTPSFKMIPNSHVRKGTRGAVCRLPIRTIPDMRSQTKG